MKLVVRALIGVILVAGLVVAMAFSCPDEEDFDRWAQTALEPESGSLVAKAKGKALSTQAKWTADYEDHVLWATVDAYQGGARQRFLGIMGTWFKLGEERSEG